MAYDFPAILATITEIQGKVNDLYRVVGTGAIDKITAPGLDDVPLTVAQKTKLQGDYDTLKSELATLYSQLP
jgi:hypothetical protein